MKVNKKLFVVFVMAFALAMAGGSVFSTHANAQCSLCGFSLSFLSPCNWHLPKCNCANAGVEGMSYAPPASTWHQFYNG